MLRFLLEFNRAGRVVVVGLTDINKPLKTYGIQSNANLYCLLFRTCGDHLRYYKNVLKRKLRDAGNNFNYDNSNNNNDNNSNNNNNTNNTNNTNTYVANTVVRVTFNNQATNWKLLQMGGQQPMFAYIYLDQDWDFEQKRQTIKYHVLQQFQRQTHSQDQLNLKDGNISLTLTKSENDGLPQRKGIYRYLVCVTVFSWYVSKKTSPKHETVSLRKPHLSHLTRTCEWKGGVAPTTCHVINIIVAKLLFIVFHGYTCIGYAKHTMYSNRKNGRVPHDILLTK